MSNEVLTTQIYPTGIRVTNCNLVTLESTGHSWGFPRQRASRVGAKCRRWRLWSKARAQSSKWLFHITLQVSGRTMVKFRTQTNAMSTANLLHLEGAIMKSHNSYRAATCGCSTSHKMIIYFLWASVWSESNLLSLCGRNKQVFFCFYFLSALMQSRESEEGSSSSCS